jgi:prepilin-type processing-associated H-X9-DG protein
MKWAIPYAVLTAVVCLFVVQVGTGAPGPKSKDDPPGPITDEQLQATEKNLKGIALAWHNYESAKGFFPSDVVDAKGKPILSWRVLILPYIENQEGLYKGFKLNEPWDSENNKKLIDSMPKVFAPVRGKADPGMTFYQSFSGKNGVLKPGQKITFASIPDGTSNTLMVAEAAKPVIWSKPGDLPFDGKDVPALGGMFDGKFHAAFCDGSVARFRKGIKDETLRRLIDPADGQVINRDEGIDKDEEKK